MTAARQTPGGACHITYGSICSGIEAATAAWHGLGWRPAFFSEIEAFPRAVLAERWPGVPVHGDFTTIREGDYEPIDLLVGGPPCQDFSVAGLRAGLAGERGALTIEFVRLAERLRPRWLVYENVPGILSSDDGRAFGLFLGALGECGYGTAWRVLDAQHFGVPQRRRRVFVVGYLGDWRPPAAVLLERESLRGDTAPRRAAGEGTPAAVAHCVDGGNGFQDDRDDGADNLIVAHSLRAEGFDASEDGTGRGVPLVTHSLTTRSAVEEDGTGRGVPLVTAFDARAMSVRRLTPQECEKLQGFWPGYTAIPYRGNNRVKPGQAADGPRYRALGNSMAVPCMRWIGERIAMVEELP